MKRSKQPSPTSRQAAKTARPGKNASHSIEGWDGALSGEALDPAAPTAAWPAWWAYAALTALVFTFFWDSFLAGKALVMRDTFIDFMSWRAFGREAFRAGALPLWNPYSHCGQPFIANPQTAFFYPPHLLFYLLPPVLALKAWQVFHFALAAMSMHALARHWRLSVPAAMLAAVGFAFSTYMLASLEFQSLFGPAAWSPLALLLTSRLAEARRADGLDAPWRRLAARMTPDVLALAVVMACQFLSGYQQTFIHGMIIDTAFLAAVCLARRDPKGLGVCGAAWTLAGTLALGLSMTQFLLTLQLVPLSVRAADYDPQMTMASLHPSLILSWLLPFLAGHPGHLGQWWGHPKLTMYEFWVGTAYVGLAPLTLATMALTRLVDPIRRRGRIVALTVFLSGTILFGLLMALGCHAPFYELAYRTLPLINKFRWPSKFLQFIVFALPLLGALGLQALLEDGGPLERRLRLAVAVAWALLWAGMAVAWLAWRDSPGFFGALTNGAFVADPKHPEFLAGLGTDLGLAVLFLGLALAAAAPLLLGAIPARWRQAWALTLPLVAFVNLFVISRQVQPILTDEIYRAKPSEAVELLDAREPGRFFSTQEDNQYFLYGVRDPKFYAIAKNAIAGESSLPDHVFKVNGGETLKLAAYERFVQTLRSLPAGSPQWQRVANLLNLRYVVATPFMPDMILGSAPATLRPQIMTNDQALPRALVASAWTVLPVPQAAIPKILDQAFDLSRSVVVDAVPDGWPTEQALPAGTPNSPVTRLAEAGVDKIEYGWNRVDLTARSSGRALLFLDDVAYPGWSATVDGKPVPILRANVFFRAVPLESAGVHRVSFTFWPPLVTAGLLTTAFTLLVMAALGAFAWRARRMG